MKELTTLNNKFTESDVKKDNKFSRSRNFDFNIPIFMSVSYSWKSHFGENTKYGNITDMFNKYRRQKQESQSGL